MSLVRVDFGLEVQFFSSDLIALALWGGSVEHQDHMVFVPALVISVPSLPKKMHNSPGLGGGGREMGLHTSSSTRGAVLYPSKQCYL